MKATQKLHDVGQSLWLDNITRTMLGDGTLKGYIDELSVTGLTSNPTIFDKAISGGDAYDDQIAAVGDAAEAGEGVGANTEERIFFELAYDFLVVLGRSAAILVIQVVWVAALVPALLPQLRAEAKEKLGRVRGSLRSAPPRAIFSFSAGEGSGLAPQADLHGERAVAPLKHPGRREEPCPLRGLHGERAVAAMKWK